MIVCGGAAESLMGDPEALLAQLGGQAVILVEVRYIPKLERQE